MISSPKEYATQAPLNKNNREEKRIKREEDHANENEYLLDVLPDLIGYLETARLYLELNQFPEHLKPKLRRIVRAVEDPVLRPSIFQRIREGNFWGKR